MTALTPQQMRELAEDAEKLTGDSDYDYVFIVTVMKTLRTAADQLEAVQAQREAFLDSSNLDPAWIAGWHAAVDHVTHILTADTAPQDVS